MTTLVVTYWCCHLTTTEVTWRQNDWDVRAIVKGMKREPFRGELRVTISKKSRTFTSETMDEFLGILLPMVGASLAEKFGGPIDIVPIPNSNVAITNKIKGRTEELAELMARGYGSNAIVVPALRWKEVRSAQHKKKEYRHPDHFEPLLRLATKPARPVVLFDDVITSGSQMIAAARFLTGNGVKVVGGLAIAKASSTQQEGKFVEKREETYDLSRTPFNLDEIDF